MTSLDNYLSDVFQEPPLIGFRRKKNIRELLMRAKVLLQEISVIIGMNNFNKPCVSCPFVKEIKVIKCDKFSWQIRKHLN